MKKEGGLFVLSTSRGFVTVVPIPSKNQLSSAFVPIVSFSEAGELGELQPEAEH